MTGPYLDNMGRDMLRGGGKMVVSSGGGRTNGKPSILVGPSLKMVSKKFPYIMRLI